MIKRFVHPYLKQELRPDADGNLFLEHDGKRDLYRGYDGCFDFSIANTSIKNAREVYDEFYAQGAVPKLTVAEVESAWRDRTVPWRKTMLENLAPLKGRRVLLLGNGASYRELYFLHLGAELVFTDLSLVAARKARQVFRNSELWEKYKSQIEFHAVDAMHLPFPDESFDVVYGTKFVGFLSSLPDFLTEVRRCLKPGGICRFTDDAVSPAWEVVRRNVVHPIKARLHKSRHSLAAVRSASSFGLKEDALSSFVGDGKFARLIFVRQYFLLRAVQLCYGKAVAWNPKRLRYAKPVFLCLKWMDDRLAHTAWMRRNALGLTWGFDK